MADEKEDCNICGGVGMAFRVYKDGAENYETCSACNGTGKK